MSDLHPPTYEIRVRHTDADGNSHIQTHWVWDSAIFMEARQRECAEANAQHREKHNKPGGAKAELL